MEDKGGEGKNLFSREKKDNGADVRPPPRDTISPCREQREKERVLKCKKNFVKLFHHKVRRFSLKVKGGLGESENLLFS